MEIESALVIAQLLLKYGPDVAESVAALFHKTTPPTADEWKAVFAKTRATYEDYVKPV